MLRLLAVIRRNFKLLIRSKTSGLIVILGPLLLIFLVGLAFNTSNLYSINVGTYRPDQNDLSESFLWSLKDKQMTITEFDTQEECIQSVRWGETHACMVFPADFQIQNDRVNEIVLYADTSQVNLVYMVLDTVGGQVSTTSTELTTGLTEIILAAVLQTRQTLQNDSETLAQAGAQRTKADIERETAKTTLGKLNLNMPSSGVEELEDGTADFTDYINDLTNAAGDAISELRDLVTKIEDNAEDIINDIEDLEPPDQMSTDDAQAILNWINESLDTVSDVEERLDEAEGNASAGIDDIDELIEDVGDNMLLVEKRLEQAKAGKTAVNDNLAAIKAALNRSDELSQQIIKNHNSLLALLDAIPVTSASSIASPITTRIEPVTAEKSNLGYLYPSLLMLLLMFICLLLSSTLVIMERRSLATFRNFCTPTRDISFTFGTYFTTLTVVAIQLGIIIGISAVVFKAAFVLNFGTMLLLLLLLCSLFIFLGMAVGNFFSTEETVTMASISIGSLFLMMSDLILPVESMPTQIANIAAYNPFVLGSNLLKQVMLFDFTIMQLAPTLLLLAGYSVAVFIFTLTVQKLMKRRFLKRYTRFNIQKGRDKAQMKKDPSEGLVVEKATVHSLGELAQIVSKMKTDEYAKYVTAEKNVFSDWVRKAYDDAELAGKLTKQIHPRRQARLLRKAQKERDSIK